MKRSQTSSRAMRNRTRTNETKGASTYAIKRKSGRMMYGPGCCAHHFSPYRNKSA
jgi:hypothetical protein